MKYLRKSLFVLYIILFVGFIFIDTGGYNFVKSNYFDSDIEIPKEFYACFKELDQFGTQEQRLQFKKTSENELASKYHFGVGLYIRNNWIRHDGLHINLRKAFENIGIYNVDDMSGIIIDSYHRYINDRKIHLKEQVDYYHNPYKIYSDNSEILELLLVLTFMQIIISFILFNRKMELNPILFYCTIISTNFILFIVVTVGIININIGKWPFNIDSGIGLFLSLFNFFVFLISIIYYFITLIKKWIGKRKVLQEIYDNKN